MTPKSAVGRALALAAASLFTAAAVGADAVSPPATAEETLAPVEIVGLKNAARVGYERLLQGVATFTQHHALAPAAELQFEVFDRAAEPRSVPVVKLDVPDRLISLDVGADGRFVLPGRDVAGPGEGELVSNRRTGELRIYPSVRSPGTSAEDRRLGDLRAECEVLWTVYRDETAFLLRNAADLVGGICRHRYISVGMPSVRKVVSATLSHDDRSLTLPLSASRLGYVPPMHDTGWPDDARVRIVFE